MAGQLDKAAAVHNELLRIHGRHALSHCEIGLIYQEIDSAVEAESEFTKFLEMWFEADASKRLMTPTTRWVSELHDCIDSLIPLYLTHWLAPPSSSHLCLSKQSSHSAVFVPLSV